MENIYKNYKKENFLKKMIEKKLTLIDGDIDSYTSSIIIEDGEGYRYLTTTINIIKDGRLNKFHPKNKFVINNIKTFLKNEYPNIILLSTKYDGIDKRLKFKCLEHDFIFEKTLRKMKGCPKCTGSYVYSLEETSKMLIEINPNIKILKEYKNKNNNRLFECVCLIDGNIWSASFSDLITFKHGCLKCSCRNKIGKGNPNYNNDKTEEERKVKREYTEYYNWREEVYKRDNYTCICCGYDKGKKLNAHHLNGYSWDKEHRTDINNGVTLCKECHEKFHNRYGYGYNTIEQFEEYYNNEFNKDLKEIILP